MTKIEALPGVALACQAVSENAVDGSIWRRAYAGGEVRFRIKGAGHMCLDDHGVWQGLAFRLDPETYGG